MILGIFLFHIMQLLQLQSPSQVVPINLQKPLTVCEVLADLPKYRGSVIQVRDEWLGTNLYGRDCAPPRTGPYVWEPAIWLIEPTSPILEKQGTPVPWSLDQRAYDQAVRELRIRGNQAVIATFVGRLESRAEGLQTARGGGDNLVGNGYGHLARFPAQLVIATVKDVTEKKQ